MPALTAESLTNMNFIGRRRSCQYFENHTKFEVASKYGDRKHTACVITRTQTRQVVKLHVLMKVKYSRKM